MSARQRIVSALAANGFGQMVTIGTQFLLTPMFFRLWGAGLYGEWLMLSAIPAYLALADLGVSSAAGNDMVMRAGAGNLAGAQQTFRGARSLARLAAAFAVVLGLLLSVCCAWMGWPVLVHIPMQDAALILLMLSLQVALGFSGSVVQAGFRCAGFNGLGTTWANLARLAETLVCAIALWSGQAAVTLCAATLTVRALMLLWQWALLRKRCVWLFYPPVAADPHMLRRLLWPSLAFMAFPVAYALALQGPILLIGSMYGSTAVAVFAAMRTLARLPVQLTNVLNNAVSPEVSRAHGAGNLAQIRRLHRTAWALTAGLGLLVCTALGLLGPWISRVWLGPGHHDQLILLMLLAVSLVSAVWNVSSVVLTATNAHVRLSVVFLVVNALGMALAAFAGLSVGMTGLLAALLLVEVAMLAWVLPAALKASGDGLPAFLRLNGRG
jgi:O-antigen/teichoic acid export membrane protein